MGLRHLLVALAAGSTLLGTAGSAIAENQTLSFDDVASGTAITDQYQSTFGIRFGRGFTGPQGLAAFAHTAYAAQGYPTQSPPNELDFSSCDSGDIPNCGAELWMKLTKPQTAMSLRFGLGLSNAQSTSSATITTYTVNQTKIKDYAFPTPSNGVTTLVALDKRDGAAACPAATPACNDNLPPIGYVHIDSTSPSASDYYRDAIDDVTLDTAVSDQGPDFGLSLQGNDTSEVTLRSGGTYATIPLTIARDGGSNGAISLSASNLPDGVTVGFSPNPYTGGTTGPVSMTIASAAGHAFSEGPITVTATPSSASAGSAPRSIQIPLRVQSTYDLKNVQIQQAQAVGALGTQLIEGRKTIVRMTAQAVGATGGKADLVYGQLLGSRGGQPLPGSPLSPDREPEPMNDADSGPQMYDPAVGLTFTLPPSWTTGTIDLEGHVFDNDPTSPSFVDNRRQVECDGCGDDNRVDNSGISFTPTHAVDISPVQLFYKRGGINAPGDPADYTEDARITSPVSDSGWGLRSYQGSIDISDIAALKSKDGDDEKNGKVYTAVSDWEFNQFEANGKVNKNGFFTVGINDSIARGLSGNLTITNSKGATLLTKPVAVVDLNRPLSSVAHELGHAYGRLHADQSCGGQAAAAGGSDPGWPNPNGLMDGGFGVDVRNYGGPASPYKLFDPTKTYDFMSYCGNDTNEWISSRGWDQALQSTRSRAATRTARAQATRRARAAASATDNGPSLLVSGFQVNGGATYFDAPQPSTGTPGSPAASPFTAQAVDTDGDPIATTKLEVTPGHADPGEGQPAASMSLLFGAVPTLGKDVGGLVVRNGTKVLSRMKASKHAPKVKITTPKIPAKGAAPANVTIRWKASDADHDKLKATVSYSTDDGKHFRVIFMGPNHGKATLAASLLTASKRARVRVLVSDGFHAAKSTSKRFRSRGAAPTARVASPVPGTAVDSAAHIYLDGLAWDDAGYRLRSHSSIRWYDGSRLVARGPVASVTGLSRGRHVLRMVATDRLGRTRVARRAVRILR